MQVMEPCNIQAKVSFHDSSKAVIVITNDFVLFSSENKFLCYEVWRICQMHNF